MYKQTNTICNPKRIWLFALIINCTILMKTYSQFSQSVYTISDRMPCKSSVWITKWSWQDSSKDDIYIYIHQLFCSAHYHHSCHCRLHSKNITQWKWQLVCKFDIMENSFYYTPVWEMDVLCCGNVCRLSVRLPVCPSSHLSVRVFWTFFNMLWDIVFKLSIYIP